jgi:hypothetical protein
VTLPSVPLFGRRGKKPREGGSSPLEIRVLHLRASVVSHTGPRMALQMARPWKDPKTCVWHLRQRLPRDLVVRVKGRMVTLPIGEDFATVRMGDAVQVSLRTKDPRKAKQLHASADAALREFYDRQRNGPIKLSHKASRRPFGPFLPGAAKPALRRTVASSSSGLLSGQPTSSHRPRRKG